MRHSQRLSAVAVTGVVVLMLLGGTGKARAQQAAQAASATPPGTLGLMVTDSTFDPQFAGLPGTYVLSVLPGSNASAAGLATGDVILALDDTPTPTRQSMQQALTGRLAGQIVTLDLVRGDQPLKLSVMLEKRSLQTLRNADRPGGRGNLFGSWGEPTRDPIRVGDVMEGILEPTDSGVGKAASDDYLLKATAGQALAAMLETNGSAMGLHLYQCADGAPETRSTRSAEGAKTQLRILFTPGASCESVIRVDGVQGGDPYRVYVRAQTPAEFASYQAEMQEYYAAQERQRQQQAYEDSQPSMFGAIVRGLAMGVSGVEGPLMNADGSEPNTLEVLNAANAALARQNAEGQARLEASIRYAQRQAERQQAEQARAQAQADADARAAAQVQAQAQAAQATAVASSQADAATQQREAQALADAAAAEARATAEAQARDEAQAQAEATARAEAEAAAEQRRQEEQARLAERQRKEAEARRPVAFAEGVTLCKLNRGTEWRCDGPLQVSYGNIEASLAAVQDACGSNGGARDLGVVGGYRAFGCGFGIHPTDRDYPGNRDVPAQYGLYIPSRATFHCPKSTNAYCRG